MAEYKYDWISDYNGYPYFYDLQLVGAWCEYGIMDAIYNIYSADGSVDIWVEADVYDSSFISAMIDYEDMDYYRGLAYIDVYFHDHRGIPHYMDTLQTNM